MPFRKTFFLFVLTSFFGIQVFSQDIKLLTENYEVTLNDGFNDKSIEDYDFTNTSNWIVTKNGSPGKDLKCVVTSQTPELQYFPMEMMFVRDLMVDDFIMEFDYLQKSRDFSVRDICILFGYKDSTKYYFAQAAAEMSKYQHNIFKVDGDRPVKIGNVLNKGMIWDYQEWHKIVLVRNVQNKKVELFIDGELIMSAEGDIGEEGKVGIGTYGSGFKIDNLKIWTPKEIKEKKDNS